MTNKEILQADLLDILFEHRNKLYGAYSLRKHYTQRLGLALGVALSTVLLFVLMSFMNKKHKNIDNGRHVDIVKLTELTLPKDKPKDPEPPRDQPKPKAQSAYQRIVVVPDKDADTFIVQNKDLINTVIGNKNIGGDNSEDLAKTKPETNGDGNVPVKETERNDEPMLPSREPSFPGGPSAWLSFLQKYLQAPEDIEPGQRIEVQVRFWVDVDGSVSRPEILKSGGGVFDKEVLRVLKKMPKWEPALQAGRPIAVAYQQPVIFIGQEQ